MLRTALGRAACLAALLWGLGTAGCTLAGEGACQRDADCPIGNFCHAQLGCVPTAAPRAGDDPADDSSGWNGDPAGSDVSPYDCEKFRDSCSADGLDECARLLDGCRQLLSCDDLVWACAANLGEACTWASEARCDTAESCGADGACPPDCANDGAGCDVGQSGCPQDCGELPQSALETCAWSCQFGACMIVARQPGQIEQCDGPDGPMLDEDCDGLVDCEDRDCAGSEACR